MERKRYKINFIQKENRAIKRENTKREQAERRHKKQTKEDTTNIYKRKRKGETNKDTSIDR